MLWLCGILAFVHNVQAQEVNRIVGGVNHASSVVTYQVSVQLRGPTYASTVLQHINWQHWCGGAIVSRRSVLTAANCVADHKPADLSLLVGTSQLDDVSSGTRLLVSDIVVHPDYELTKGSDIAVLRSAGPFVWNEPTIMPIHYTNELIGGGVDCVLTGWGYTHIVQHMREPSDLNCIVLTTITNAECNERGISADDTSLCTLAPLGRGACAGDTGGPLVKENILVGILSHGTGLCGIGLPDLYTRVSVFADWIHSNSAE